LYYLNVTLIISVHNHYVFKIKICTYFFKSVSYYTLMFCCLRGNKELFKSVGYLYIYVVTFV